MLAEQDRAPVAPMTPWQLLTGNPLRFLRSSWPWRSAAYVLTSWLVACAWWVATLLLLCIPAAWPLVLLTGIPLAAVERWRVRLVDPRPAPSAHPPLVRPGLWGWITARYRETTTWQELVYALVFAFGLAWLDLVLGALLVCVAYLIAFPALISVIPALRTDEFIVWLGVGDLPAAFTVTVAGVLLAPLIAYLLTAYAAGRAAMTRTRLVSGPDGATDAQVIELTRSRARILEAFDAQRRRIERDLHDGAQQRLTGLVMTLGLARLELDDATPEARRLVDKAHGQAMEALTELRDLVHGIHPQVLTDRGLAPALAELAGRSPIPVELHVDLPRRPPRSAEAAVWFIAGEALANVAKHSRADRAWVTIRMVGAHLSVDVRDDGDGGADPHRGTGLVGLADRVSVLGGTISLTSPAGGPTVLRVELPCE